MSGTGRGTFFPASGRKLRDEPTLADKIYASTQAYHRLLADRTKLLGQLQRKLVASNSGSLLVVFEGLDASGKDGAIRRIYRDCDIQACRFSAFEQPDATERRYDFLWRFNRNLPRSGELAVFNRSHYGDVVIPRVHPELLDARQVSAGRKFWEDRYESIVEWEAHLARNGTRLVKIFLHISPHEQRRRLIKRLERRGKSWKAEFQDVCDHHRFEAYLRWYGESISRTHAESAPWFIVPADDKRNARLAVADIVLQALRGIDPQYPRVSKIRSGELDRMRSILVDKTSAQNTCESS
jgi:PPK2 family polyphosphate:nucleotide phosphotransferase